MQRIDFYCLKNDIIEIITQVEDKLDLHYISQDCNKAGDDNPIVNSLLNLENLGQSNADSTMSSRAYIAKYKTQNFMKRCVPLYKGGQNCFYDQLYNDASVFVRLGGLYENGDLIMGDMTTCHNDLESQTIIKTFAKVIRKLCIKYQDSYIGKEAMAYLMAGNRLTVASNSSYSMSIPS